MMRSVYLAVGILAIIRASHGSLQCNSTSNDNVSCSRNTILAIDATTYMLSYANIRSEFDFIETWILPRLDIRTGYVGVGMTAYGTGSTTIYDFSYNKPQICENIEKLWSGVDFTTANNVPLSRTIRNLFNNFGFDYTSLVLFTGDRDQSDVDAAASQVHYYIDNKMAMDFSIVIVNYGNCSFSAWPLDHTDVYDGLKTEPDQLSQYVDNSICENKYPDDSRRYLGYLYAVTSQRKFIRSPTFVTQPPSTSAITTGIIETTATVPPSKPPSTAPPQRTTERVNTAAPITPSPSYPTLPPASSANAGCECNYGTIWLDVFLLMEATTSMQFGIEGAKDYVVSAFTKLTVGQAEQYQTRFGVIRYASDVQLIADLDTYKSTADLFDLEIKTYDDLGTNIEGALQMATNRFMSSVHRIAARPIVIIVGSSYKSGAYNDPSQAAAGFRESGGTIITIEYVQEHGLEVPVLRSLASPNYNLTNKKNDGTQLIANELRDLLCEANCFCRKNWQGYNIDKWDAPQGGCYYPVSIPAIQPLAQRTCTHDHNSTLTLVEDSAKNSFLMSIFPSKTKFWLGLTNDGDGWKWQGGYSTGFTNWGPDQPGSGRCAYMQQYSGFKFAWFSDECSDDNCYICQSKPCDSTKYCDSSS